MSSAGAASRAAAPVSSAVPRPAAQKGAQSRGPKTEEGKARAAQNARRHACARRNTWSSRTRTAPSSPTSRRRWSQSWRRSVRCRRCSHGGSRRRLALARAAELFEERRSRRGGLGLALIRDGNGTRRSRRCCAIAARRWPSSGAPCAPSTRSRPKRRRRQSRWPCAVGPWRGSRSGGRHCRYPACGAERTREPHGVFI